MGFLVKLKLAQKEALTKLAEWLETPSLKIFEAWKHIGNQGTESWVLVLDNHLLDTCFPKYYFTCVKNVLVCLEVQLTVHLNWWGLLGGWWGKTEVQFVNFFRLGSDFLLSIKPRKPRKKKHAQNSGWLFGTSLKGCRFSKESAPLWPRDLISAWTYDVEFVGQMRMREIILIYIHLDATSSHVVFKNTQLLKRFIGAMQRLKTGKIDYMPGEALTLCSCLHGWLWLVDRMAPGWSIRGFVPRWDLCFFACECCDPDLSVRVPKENV